MKQKIDRARIRALRCQASAKWFVAGPPAPVASLLSAATPLRKERHRQRYQVGFVS